MNRKELTRNTGSRYVRHALHCPVAEPMPATPAIISPVFRGPRIPITITTCVDLHIANEASDTANEQRSRRRLTGIALEGTELLVSIPEAEIDLVRETCLAQRLLSGSHMST